MDKYDVIVTGGGRVFPENNDARQIVDVLLRWLKKTGVEVKTGARVLELDVEDSRISGVLVQSGAGTTRFLFDSVVVTTGGYNLQAAFSTGRLAGQSASTTTNQN